MKHIKKFEAYAGLPIPVAPVYLFVVCIKCNSCKECFPTIGKVKFCLNCGSPEIIEISKNDYFKFLKEQHPNIDIDKVRGEMKNDIIPLGLLKQIDDQEREENNDYYSEGT